MTAHNQRFDEEHGVNVEPTVFVVDDDEEMRESLVWLLESSGLPVDAYKTPTEVLEQYEPERPGCLVVDLKMPEMSGLELQKVLYERGGRHPFIIISGHGDVTSAVASLHQGAVDFIEKPFDRKHLLRRIQVALERDTAIRRREARRSRTQAQIDALTPREREVMELVVKGLLTKQIARQLKISDKTVEVHRSHVTKKMHVENVAQLVRIMTEHNVGND